MSRFPKKNTIKATIAGF